MNCALVDDDVWICSVSSQLIRAYTSAILYLHGQTTHQPCHTSKACLTSMISDSLFINALRCIAIGQVYYQL